MPESAVRRMVQFAGSPGKRVGVPCRGIDMRRREFIKAFAATAARWTLPAGAQTRTAPSPTRPTALTQAQSDALAAYDKALNQLKSISSERRAQISSHQALPNLPGQALYLARVNM